MIKRQGSIDELWDVWRTGALRAPSSLREAFELLALYDPAVGLDALLERVEFEDTALSYSYEYVLNRAPESVDALIAADGVHPRQRFKSALLSEEFQSKIIQLLLCAYPEKKRRVFLHIPECGGTNLTENLVHRYLPLARAIESEDWTPKPKMLEWIAGIVRVAAHHKEFFVYGHTFFGDYLRQTGTRIGDRIFTVIRDPLDLLLAQANHNAGLLRKDPAATRPDTRQIMSALGIVKIPDPLSDDEIREFARQALRNAQIAQPNRICVYLGEGKAEAALNNLIIHDVEITDLHRCADWLRERFEIDGGSGMSESPSILTREDGLAELEYLQPRLAEDQIVFDCVRSALDSTEQSSVRGMQLSEFIR